MPGHEHDHNLYLPVPSCDYLKEIQVELGENSPSSTVRALIEKYKEKKWH